MATKDQVIALNRAYPDWTSSQIAEAIGAGTRAEYVRATAKRNGLTLGKSDRWRTAAQLRQKATDLIRRAEKMEREGK